MSLLYFRWIILNSLLCDSIIVKLRLEGHIPKKRFNLYTGHWTPIEIYSDLTRTGDLYSLWLLVNIRNKYIWRQVKSVKKWVCVCFSLKQFSWDIISTHLNYQKLRKCMITKIPPHLHKFVYIYLQSAT